MASSPQITQEFVSLLTSHQEVMRSYIISQLPGSPDVRDILQEVNMLLWEKMNNFELGTNFGAWACTVAHYKILDYRKKKKREGFLVFDNELSQTLTEESATHEPDHLEAKRRALKQCLTLLSAKNRDLLQARYHSPSGDMEQVSAALGRSRASLRVTLSRLRASLRGCITKHINTDAVVKGCSL